MNRTPTVTALAHVSTATARQRLLDLDTEFALIPTRSRQELLVVLDGILATAEQAQLTTAAHLSECRIELLTRLTGVTRLTAFHTTETAQTLHRHRNLLLALLVAACLGEGSHPKEVTGDFVRLSVGATKISRAYRDDEILLLRLQTLGMARHGNAKEQRSAATYAMVDAGMVPGETPSVLADDIAVDDPATAIIAAPGNTYLHPRMLPVEPLPRHLLATLLAAHAPTHAHQALTYTPRKDHAGKTEAQRYATAAASATLVIDRIRKAVGLDFADVTSSSITLWRIETVYLTNGIKAATEVSGRHSEENMAEWLYHGNTTRPRPQAADEISSFDIDD